MTHRKRLGACAALVVCLCASLGFARQVQTTTSTQNPKEDKGARNQAKQEQTADKDKAGSTASAEDEQALIRIDREVAAAMVKADTAALEQLWADEYSLTNPGGNVTPKADYLALLKSGDMKFQSLELRDVKVSVTGDTAEVTGRVSVKARFKDEEPIDEVDNYTSVYARRGGRWRLIGTKVTRPEGQ